MGKSISPNPTVESADVHTLEALVERYGFYQLAVMLMEIANERGDDHAVAVFDLAAGQF